MLSYTGYRGKICFDRNLARWKGESEASEDFGRPLLGKGKLRLEFMQAVR